MTKHMHHRFFAKLVAAILWLVLSSPPSFGGASDQRITAASTAISACFARDDPGCARPWIKQLQAKVPGSQAVAYAHGYERFLSGELAVAVKAFDAVCKASVVPRSLRTRARHYLKLAKATGERVSMMTRHELLKGRIVVLLRPGPDEVLLPFLERVLQRATDTLTTFFGPLPTDPLVIHVYPRVDDLAAVSGLTTKQIRTSGTIALCKYNRLMITSPNDLLFGYAWADTVAHELVHWLVTRKAGSGVPIWLHEGLARSFEGTWRGADPLRLAGDECAVLAKARRRKRFISFSRMSPTMAALPNQAATQLAFAEVHHAVGWILSRARKASTSGPVDVRPLLGRFAQGDDVNAALSYLLGTPWRAAQRAWKKDLVRGIGAQGKLPTPPSTLPSRLRFKRVAGPDPFKGMGSQARRWVELGDRLLAINRPMAAVIEYRKALGSGAKRRAPMMRRLTHALLSLGKFEEARQIAEDTHRRNPSDPAILRLLATALHNLKRHEQALAMATQSAWLNPYDPQLHEVMAAAHDALGRREEAARSQKLRALLLTR